MSLVFDESELYYPYHSTNSIQDLLIDDMLQKFHGASSVLDKKIKKVYKDRYQVKFRPMDEVVCKFLHGPPGHGKTSVYKSAARTVAALLGLNLRINISDNYEPNDDDLLFVSHELSAQVSAIDFGGIPTRITATGPDGESIEYMSKLPNKRLAMLKHVPASILLLDDFSNAAPSVQNVGLTVVEEGRFQGLDLGNTYIGVSGNLGSLDRTYTSPTSLAMETRCVNFYVEDTLDDWVARTIKEQNDELGDVGLIGFLQSNNNWFATEPPEGGPYPCPRTWSKLQGILRHIMYRHGSQLDKKKAALVSQDIQTIASGLVGKQAALELSAYFYALYTDAAPIAEELYTKGKLSAKSEKEFEQRYGKGSSQDNLQFGYQFSHVIANLTSQSIMQEPDKLCENLTRFADGVFRLGNSIIARASSHLAQRLKNGVPDYWDAHTNELGKEILSIKLEHGKSIVECLSAHKAANKARLDNVISHFIGDKAFNEHYLN